jgi:hypothetical protein
VKDAKVETLSAATDLVVKLTPSGRLDGAWFLRSREAFRLDAREAKRTLEALRDAEKPVSVVVEAVS